MVEFENFMHAVGLYSEIVWALKWNFGLYNGNRVVEFENFICSWALKLNQFGL